MLRRCDPCSAPTYTPGCYTAANPCAAPCRPRWNILQRPVERYYDAPRIPAYAPLYSPSYLHTPPPLPPAPVPHYSPPAVRSPDVIVRQDPRPVQGQADNDDNAAIFVENVEEAQPQMVTVSPVPRPPREVFVEATPEPLPPQPERPLPAARRTSPPRVRPPPRAYDMSDGWYTENLKVLENSQRKKKLCRLPEDEWEAGFKVVPEADPLARDRHFHKVEHPYSWMDENMKVVPQKRAYPIDVYRFVVENTGWDSAHLKTFSPEEAAPSTYGPRAPGRIAFAANHDWYVDGKVLPPQERFRRGADTVPDLRTSGGTIGFADSGMDGASAPYGGSGYSAGSQSGASSQRRGPRTDKNFVVAGTGWDSGLKVLPPDELKGGHPGSPARRRDASMWEEPEPGAPRARPEGWPKGYWDIENRKVLPWEESHTGGYAEQGRRHVHRPRQQDMEAFHRRMCQADSAYTY